MINGTVKWSSLPFSYKYGRTFTHIDVLSVLSRTKLLEEVQIPV